MAKQLIFTDKEISFLLELGKKKVKFIIVGLSAAVLQGAPAVTQDIELWFRDLNDPGIKKALKKVGGIYVPPTAITPPMFAGDNVSLFDIVVHMHGLKGFAEEYKGATAIPLKDSFVKVLPLERIIASKEATARDKDLRNLAVLRDTLVTLREVRKQKTVNGG